MKATAGLLAFKGAGSYLPPPCTLAPRHTFHGLGGSCTSVWHRGCGKGKTSLSRRRQKPFPAKGFRRHNLGQHSGWDSAQVARGLPARTVAAR